MGTYMMIGLEGTSTILYMKTSIGTSLMMVFAGNYIIFSTITYFSTMTSTGTYFIIVFDGSST